jgi:hypothetical protein
MNSKAIEILQFHAEIADPEFKDALDLAISALEFKKRYDQFWEEVKTAGKSEKEIEIHHSGRVFRIREVAQ